jgi:hypothetical protein
MNNQHAIMDDVDAAEADFSRRQHEEFLNHRTALGGDSEMTEMLEVIAKEVPEVKPHFAEAILDVLTDRGWLRTSHRRGCPRRWR